MNEDSTPEFKIRLDDEPVRPKVKIPAEKDAQSVKKLGRRMTIAILLLFILIVGAMVAGYLDIKKQLSTVHDYGTQEAQNLSSDLQSKFSTLSVKSASVEDSLTQISDAQSSLKANIDALKKDIAKVSKLADTLNASKADKKSVKDSAAALSKQLSPLSTEMQKQKSVISAIEKSTREDISTVQKKVLQVAKEAKIFQEKIDAVRAEKASKKDLLAEVDHIQKSQDKLEIGLKRVITQLESKINQLEKEMMTRTGSSKGSTAAPVVSSTTPSSTGEPKPTPPSIGKPSTPPKPGELLEQDISQ